MTVRNFIIVALLCSQVVVAQDVEKYASAIQPKALKENLEIIASDALEGRLTGSRGQKMAAAFIAEHFRALGLTAPYKGSYMQPFNLYSYKQEKISVRTKNKTYETVNDVVFYGSADSGGEKQYEVVFVGSGSDAELAQVTVQNRMALVIMPEISVTRTAPIIQKLTLLGAAAIMLYATVPDAEYTAAMIEMQGMGRMSLQPAQRGEAQLFFVSRTVVEDLFGSVDKLKAVMNNQKKNALKKVKPATANVLMQVKEEIVKTENVMGFMEGTDKKNEIVVITAHYDHVGLTTDDDDRVYNGADDDGSGTVAVLQLASAFAQAKKEGHGPRRSILFMTVTAEELGLYGSEYYTDVEPVFPLERTVVDLNIDMIGRWDPEHKEKAPYVYVIGADKLSSQLQEISVRNNEKYTKLEFDYTYNDVNHPTNLYQRSDHWNFAKHGVPIVFYFDGLHEDYHTAKDEVDRIDFDILAARTKVVFFTAWEIANREQRLKVDK